ncbi:MAG: polyprenyl synthetase family protein [Pirellulales bacterium]|nr:polyprenyl synthetase family protein [Pirellulales bacterium]
MEQTTFAPATVPDALRAIYAPIAAQLAEVEELLREELQSDHPFVDQLVKHGFHLGGKRLRPALVLLSGLAAGKTERAQVVLGAAVELIHTATLIHDDVLDEATLRRHLDTVNARWDNEASVLLGDYLLAHALCLTSSLGDLYAVRELSNSSRTICDGELRQIESRGKFDLREDQYVAIVGRKTAELLACCCRLGAHCAGGEAKIHAALDRYGHQLGIAFQIADDVLDLLGDEKTVGKSLGTDLAKQKFTLPLIRLLDQVSTRERPELLALLTASDNHRREALRPWFARFDAIEYARHNAEKFARRAAEELQRLPPSPARDSLAELTRFVVQRKQ